MSHEIALLEKALEASPDNWQVRRSLAAQQAQAGNTAEASRLMVEAPEIPEGEKDQVFAAQLMAETHPDEAHKLLDEFLEANAASGQGHLLKGRLRRAEGDKEKAESHFKVAAILDPSINIEEELATGKDESVAVVEVKEEEEDEDAVDEAIAIVTAAQPTAPAAEPEPKAQVAVAKVVEEEAIPVVPAAVPLSPKPLAPPPSGDLEEEEEKEAAPTAAEDKKTEPEIPPASPSSAAGVASAAVATALPIEGMHEGDILVPLEHTDNDEEWDPEEHHGERAFIVGEGEMVHAHDKDPDAKEKLSAIAVAVMIHLGVFALLGLIGLAMPRPQPPQITASAMADNGEESMENQTVTKMQQKTAAAVSAQPVVSVESFSSVAVPDMPDMTTDLTMVSLSDGDTGIGMSMSGFGDVSNMGAIPPAMRSRCSMSQRMQRLRESGGEDRCEKAVRNALEWLAAQQNENGSFGKKYHCAMSGLTLLAFLGHCETPESPKFGEAVVGSALYLMEVAKKRDGYMWNGESGNHKAYEHAIATYALCELYTMTKESGKPVPGLETVLRRSVDHIVDGQTKYGGWAYGYAQNNRDDMSVAGWQIQALKAAYNTGKKFPGVERSLDKSMDYLKKIQDGEGAFKYTPEQPKGKPTLTGAALLGMQIWDEMDSAEYKKGLAYLSKKYANPTPGTNFYAPYYNTQAFFLHGDKEWEAYNNKFQAKLLDAQNPDGSWTKPGVGGHGAEDSHIMNTAWGCLMLEVYYRYLPTTDKVEGL